MKVGDKDLEVGPVMLLTRCECRRYLPQIPMDKSIAIHMPTKRTEFKKQKGDNGEVSLPTNTEIRAFFRTEEFEEQKFNGESIMFRIYVEGVPE